ncbi:hypothetical protein ACFPIJ_37465 [Dactylosporangium cerinum]|uniref:Uncharacterized protein n=1 Tax=Dactylosporangium cerinum TaxID=1434730 RepID=A0ABV9W817_9ACTN
MYVIFTHAVPLLPGFSPDAVNIAVAGALAPNETDPAAQLSTPSVVVAEKATKDACHTKTPAAVRPTGTPTSGVNLDSIPMAMTLRSHGCRSSPRSGSVR